AMVSPDATPRERRARTGRTRAPLCADRPHALGGRRRAGDGGAGAGRPAAAAECPGAARVPPPASIGQAVRQLARRPTRPGGDRRPGRAHRAVRPTMQLLSVNTGIAREVEIGGRTTRSAIAKTPAPGRVDVRALGPSGDR